MIEINPALTRRVAKLARLDLTDSEADNFTAQLGQILQYVDQLGEVNLHEGKEVEPLTHPLDLPTPMREDEPIASPPCQAGEGGYRVPPIM
jgi:aspartyl-tRNA(Asn)/glutamyl-tRNA(Gln) amidotransferase subunit C